VEASTETFLVPSQVGSDVAKELAALGVIVVEVDYDSPSSLASALTGVEVVVSTLAGAGFAAQIPLALAAKETGVQLFVPRSARSPCFGRFVVARVRFASVLIPFLVS